MSHIDEQELVALISRAILLRQGLAPSVRSEVLRLPRFRRKEASTRLAVLSLSLLAEDPEHWRAAIATLTELLQLIEESLHLPEPTRH